MTETSATEELRRLLDEHGIKWWEGDDERKTLWESNGLTWEYFNDENGDAWLGFLGACEQDITPEQAIAVTLWSGVERSKTEYATLTAEQVMAIVARHQPDYCSDTHVCFDWQAIADELSAELRGDAE